MTRLALAAALAAALALAGCASLRAIAPGGLSAAAGTAVQARAEMTDRLALGYALVAAYAEEIRLGVTQGYLHPAEARDRLERLRQAKAALDVAADLYLDGASADAEARLRAFDALMLELRAWLARKGESR